MNDAILAGISALFGAGVFVGTTRARIAGLCDMISKLDERLDRIEKLLLETRNGKTPRG